MATPGSTNSNGRDVKPYSSRLDFRKMVVNLEEHLKGPDVINVLAYLMGVETFRSIEEETKISTHPLFLVMEKVEATGEEKDDIVDLLIAALETLALEKAVNTVKTYKKEICGSAEEKEDGEPRDKYQEFVQSVDKFDETYGKKFSSWCKTNNVPDPKKATGDKVLLFLQSMTEKYDTKLKAYRTIRFYLENFSNSIEERKKVAEYLSQQKELEQKKQKQQKN